MDEAHYRSTAAGDRISFDGKFGGGGAVRSIWSRGCHEGEEVMRTQARQLSIGLVAGLVSLVTFIAPAGAQSTTTTTSTTTTSSSTSTTTTTSTTTSSAAPTTTLPSTTTTTTAAPPTTLAPSTTVAAPPTTSSASVLGTQTECPSGSYINADGIRVCSPTTGATDQQPTARCNDGTLSYSRNRQGTCSGHGGVDEWLTSGGSGSSGGGTSGQGSGGGTELALTGPKVGGIAALGSILLGFGLFVRRRGDLALADLQWRKRRDSLLAAEARRRAVAQRHWHW